MSVLSRRFSPGLTLRLVARSGQQCRLKRTTKQTVNEKNQVMPARTVMREIERRIRTTQMETMILNDVGALTKAPNMPKEAEQEQSSESIVSHRFLASNPAKFSDQLASIKDPDILTRNRSKEEVEPRRVKSRGVQLPLGKFAKVAYSDNHKSVGPKTAISNPGLSPDRGFHVEGDVYKDEYVAGAVTDLPAEKELEEDTMADVQAASAFTRSDRKQMLENDPYRLRFGAEDAVEEIDFVLPTQQLPEQPRKLYRKWRPRDPTLDEKPPEVYVSADKLYVKKKVTVLDDKGFGEETETEEWKQYYGTVNRSVKPAEEKHRCGGCGATFHCQDSSLPGFLPAELFLEKQEQDDFGGTFCRRCYLVQRHNFLINVSVSPVDYERVLGHLRTVEDALVLLLVDMTDFPACIYPKLPDLIGHGKPLIVIGNKVDLLPPDAEKGYVRHFESCLRRTVTEMGFANQMNLLAVKLISAKTGYGIEDLITLIFSKWANRGDVYLIGCTNTGKSTLFNALLQSDLCKVRAVDLLERATTSLWPGTTLNLLKFPVMNPSEYRLIERKRRLRHMRQIADAEQQHRRALLEQTGESKYMMLQGLVGRTDEFDEEEEPVDSNDTNDRLASKIVMRPRRRMLEGDFTYGRWCFDTPGTVHHEQLINYMTLDELIKTVPRSMLQPRTYTLGRNETMFIGGLARIDFLSGPRGTLLTVFASEELPIYVEETNRADELYRKYVGTAALAVPYGNKERLAAFPSLKRQVVKLVGSGSEESCADVTLSSAGWLSVTAPTDQEVRFGVWTPGGVGIFVRKPALLPFIVNTRGKRIAGTNSYENKPVAFKDENEELG